MVARRAHNPKVVGSNPASATTRKADKIAEMVSLSAFFIFCLSVITAPARSKMRLKRAKFKQNHKRNHTKSPAVTQESRKNRARKMEWTTFVIVGGIIRTYNIQVCYKARRFAKVSELCSFFDVKHYKWVKSKAHSINFSKSALLYL